MLSKLEIIKDDFLNFLVNHVIVGQNVYAHIIEVKTIKNQDNVWLIATLTIKQVKIATK